MTKDEWPKEKKWKNVYTRSEKLHRAKQLGFEYPILTEKKLLDGETTNVLFVCSKNQWRSPTAEKIYSEHPLLNVKSGGTSSSARHSVNAADIKAIGISYQMHGLVLVDENQQAIRNSIIWCDSRAVPYGEKAFNTLGGEQC